MRVIFATLFALVACQAIADEPTEPKKEEVGRYAVSGEWRLDTKTGYVEKLSVIYDRQMRFAAKEIEAETGQHVVSIEGYKVGSSYTIPLAVPSVAAIRFQRPEDRPVTRMEFDAFRNLMMRRR